MPSQIPALIQDQRYVSLTTFRKSGAGVPTPVWFGEDNGKIYVMTRSDMGKTKRVRNNPRVSVAPCSIRGKVKGPKFPATARMLPPEDHAHARQTINRKYFMARITSPWSRADVFLEISFE
jgi:PPOX class probable F420-dependent enzyme